MITTRDLQAANKAVHDARRSGDDAAYDAALGVYSRLLEQWAQEGQQIASEARLELAKDPAMRRLFKQE